MSYSPLTSDDDSISALLRRLDANPRIDAFRTDPLQVLREARMKVAARARATGAGPEGILAGNTRTNSIDEIPAAWDDANHTAILLPAEFSEEDEAKREASNGALVVVNEIDDVAPKARRGWFKIGGAGLAAGAALAVSLGLGLPDLSNTAGSEQAAATSDVVKATGQIEPEMAGALPPSTEGVGRFTVAAFNFADIRTTSMPALDPTIAEVSGREAAMPDAMKAVTTTRLDVSAGDQVTLPIELSPAKGTGEVAAIVLRGLPNDYSVVAAMPSGDGSWVLSPDGLGAARIMVPAGVTGEVNVTAELFDISAQVVGSPRFVLNVGQRKIGDKHDPRQG